MRRPNFFVRNTLIATFCLIVTLKPTTTQAQLQIRDFTRPFVVLDTEGHSAPVRSLLFVEPGQIVSGGFDKMIHTWDFADGRPKLDSTIRPATWRGNAGAIYAMALSPKIVGQNNRILAVGGIGLWSTQGNITLFRYPGNPAMPNGEVLAILPSRMMSDPNSHGHSKTITSLNFSPDGKYLASASNDGRVLLWDVASKLPVKTLKDVKPSANPPLPVNALAFSPDGQRLAAAGADGFVRVWDIKQGTLVVENAAPRSPTDPDTSIILSLAYSPDGKYVVVGTEGAQVIRYDVANSKQPAILMNSGDATGPIDAVAISHNGKMLATSVVSNRMKADGRGERPKVDSHVQLRSFPDGKKLGQPLKTNNMIYAIAFSPDDTKLAFSGGDRQTIAIHSLDRADQPVMELQGRGESVWRVGFLDDSRTVGFSNAQESLGANVEYIGFQLKTQTITPIEPANLRRAITSWEGWSVKTVDPYLLKVSGPNHRTFDIALSPRLDRRWWAWSFIPPKPSHPKPMLAVACEAGILFYRLDDGVRTRSFAGHSSPVYDLAPSPDGMWLVTGSSDQTVRIWSLAGCDSLPALGATFRKRPDGKNEVSKIVDRSFAEAMGLKVGDVLAVVAVAGEDRKSLENLQQLDTLPPPTRIEFRVQRGAEVIDLVTTRRDSPRMTLFMGIERDWVIWTPEGYYQTSIAGDRKYLGWHRNGPTLNQTTDRFPAETFEKELRRPDVLAALIDTDNPAQAQALVLNQNTDPAAIIAAQAPPIVTMTPNVPKPLDGPVVAPPQGLVVEIQVAAEGRSPITSIQTLVDGREPEAATVYAVPPDTAKVKITPQLHPGTNNVVTIVTNREGKKRTTVMEVISPVATAKAPMLHVLAIGASGPFRAAKFPTIPHAAEDAKELRAFFAAPGGKKRFDRVNNAPALIDDDANGKTLRETLQAFEKGITDSNDVLIVMLESHMLTGQKLNFVIASDTKADPKVGDTLTADDIATTLADIASRGCKVILLLDTSHEKAPKECSEGLTDFVRSVTNRGVITFIAANHGYSRALNNGQGAFAQAILDVFKARSISRPMLEAGQPMTLDDFQDAVVNQVLKLTSRKQFASCYIPTTISSSSLIFEPNRPSNIAEMEAKKVPPLKP